MAAAISVVPLGGVPVTFVGRGGIPVTFSRAGGVAVTPIDNATPITLVDETGTPMSVFIVPPGGRSATQVSHTGSTAETTLATVTIPGGSMGANGAVRVTALFSHNNDASLKTLRIKFGGTEYLATTPSTSVVGMHQRLIQNRNSASSQVGTAAAAGGSFGASGGALVTSSVNTASDVTLLITGQLADSADNVALESYLVEILYAA